MTVFVTGNSHVAALAAAAPDSAGLTVFPLGNGRVEKRPFSERTSHGVALTAPEYAANLRAHAGRDELDPADTWGLLMVNSNSRIYRHRMWHEYAPAGHPGRPLSHGVVSAIVEADHQHVRTFLDQLADAGVDFFTISAPPPRRDLADERGLAPDTLLAVDALARSIWSTWVTDRGIACVTPPPEVADDEGFLRPEFAQATTASGRRDIHHANRAYGELMVHRIRDHVSGRSAP